MAAPSYVFTISRIARMLGVDKAQLQDVAADMEPEDGCLRVLDVDDLSTIVFTAQGIENLKELLGDLDR